MRNPLLPWLAAWLLLTGAAPAYLDETIRVDVPEPWSIDGQAGEYHLVSEDQDIASLLLLLTPYEGTLEERLAEIEAQFVETGMIEPDGGDTRKRDGTEILYRRYRLMLGGPEAEADDVVILHQYSFRRGGVPILLQVESPPERDSAGALFERIFDTLELVRPPEWYRFESAPSPWVDPEG